MLQGRTRRNVEEMNILNQTVELDLQLDANFDDNFEKMYLI